MPVRKAIERETAFSAYQAAVEYCCLRTDAFDNDRICESLLASVVERSIFRVKEMRE